MTEDKKGSEYRVANYDGGLKVVPEAGLAGTVEIKPDGVWNLHLGFGKNAFARFEQMPLQVEPLSRESCRVWIRSVNNPNFAARFDLPTTPASVLEADLSERGLLINQVMAAAAERGRRKAAGQWWVGIKPYRILIGCHYSGAKTKSEVGNLEATAGGLQYNGGVFGSKVTIPWHTISDIEISTQSTKRVTAGRVLAVGVFALVAKKNETYTYVHITASNSVWSFATKSPQPKVLAAMKPVLDALNSRVQSPPPAPVAAPPSSVADELAKLAKLKADGLLTEEEFAAQKARLLS